VPNVFFLQDSRHGREHFLPYMATVDAFRRGEFTGLHIEQLHYPVKPAIWSMRSDLKTRILYISYTQYEEGEAIQGYLLLDVVLNHDYDKSRFLRSPQVLSAVLKKLGATIDEAAVLSVKDFIFEDVSVEDAFRHGAINSRPPGRGLVPLEYYHKQYISFNTEQGDVLDASLPLVVSGPPGSGKSYLALSLLLKYVREHRDAGEAFKILYVTHSPRLVADMKAGWVEMLSESDAEAFGDVLDFKTDRELIREHLADDISLTDEDDFPLWYQAYCDRHRHTIKQGIDIETMWLEFRLRCGYTEDEYRRLSIKHAIQLEFRDFVCEVYRAYDAYLTAKKLVAAELYSFPAPGPYAFIVVDEGQDFSLGNLLGFYCLAHRQLVAFVGELQTIKDRKPRIPYLCDTLGMAIKFLPTTYRCSRRVMEVANHLTELTHRITGGISVKGESARLVAASDAKLPLGEVIWLEASSHNVGLLRNKAQDPHCVVLSSEAFKAEAIKELKSPLGCLNYAEVKGLEYDEVIIWLPFGDENWTAICAQLIAKEGVACGAGSGFGAVHRPKAGHGDDLFRRDFHGLITAFTRAKVRVYLLQGLEHPFNVLQKFLGVPYIKLWREEVGEKTTSDARLHRSAWIEQARHLLLDGNSNAAARIFDTFGMRDEFHDFERQVIASVSRVHDLPPARTIPPVADALPAHGRKKKKALPAANVSSVSKEEKTEEKIKAFLENPEIFFQNEKNRRFLKQSFKSSLNEPVEHTLVYKLIRSSKGIGALNWLAKNKDILFSFIPEGIWVKPFTLDGIETNLLFFLNRVPVGQEFLQHFLRRPGKFLSAELVRVSPGSPGSLLCVWTMVPEGVVFLNCLLRFFPDIFLAIPIEEWTKLCPEYFNASALYWLSLTKQGRELLQDWFRYQWDHFLMIRIHGWGAAIRADAPDDAGTSVLFNLASSADGFDLLHAMIKMRPDIFSRVLVNGWMQKIPKKDNTSLLHTILKNDRGLDLFLALSRQLPGFIFFMSGSVWGAVDTYYDVGDKKIPVPLLYFIICKTPGIHFLRRLLKKNPSAIQAIPSEVWVVLLHELCMTEEGLAFLCELLQEYPEMIRGFPIEAWLLELPYARGEAVSVSALECLCVRGDGLRFLSLFLERLPEVVRAIPRATWEKLASELSSVLEGAAPIVAESVTDFLENLRRQDFMLAATALDDERHDVGLGFSSPRAGLGFFDPALTDLGASKKECSEKFSPH
jgi:hypothetical protein